MRVSSVQLGTLSKQLKCSFASPCETHRVVCTPGAGWRDSNARNPAPNNVCPKHPRLPKVPKFIRRGRGCKRSALCLFTGLKWDTKPSPHVTLKQSSAVDDPVACSTRSLCRTDSIADLKGPGSESHPNAYQIQVCWMWCRRTTVHTNPASLVCFRVADIFQSTEDTWWPFVLIPGQDPIPPSLNPGV